MFDFFGLWVKNRFFIIYSLYQNRKWCSEKDKFSSILVFLWYWVLELFSIILLVWWSLHNLFNEWEYSSLFVLNEYSYWMVILCFVLYLIIQQIRISYYIRINFLFVVLFFILQVSNWLVFYFLYEMVFVCIIFAIIILGYSYERLSALYLIIFYSFLFSRPCLIVIVNLDYCFMVKIWSNWSRLILWYLILSFMVKFPIFGFHYWLPVAHVEASTLGSMILAGILLKLGGIGVFYLIRIWSIIIKCHWLILSVLLVMILILNIRDLKIIIAYSSIAHMSLVFYIMNVGSLIAKKGVLLMIFYHGFISPLIFWLVGIYAWWKTRSLIVMKYLRVTFIFFLLIFLLIIINIRFPPFIGFLSEILILKRIVQLSGLLGLAVIRVLFSCFYNIYLLWVFSGRIGWAIKLNIRNLDVYLFMVWVIFLNF